MKTIKCSTFLGKIFIGLVGGITLLTSLSAYSKSYTASSSPQSVALIELYTSQGCSSCPPAEEWLGTLDLSGVSADEAIPIALHVDYWDYIGWKDEYAQKYFSKRQYQYAKLKHSASVYTPQIMLNGKDVRSVNFGNSLSALKGVSAPVTYEVRAEMNSDQTLKVAIDFTKINDRAKNSNVVAILAESGMTGHINAGENAGRTLKHNHVVRTWNNIGKIRQHFDVELAIKPEWKKSNLELIIFVETIDLQTLQALKLSMN